MLWVKLGTHITDHERFLRASAVARDLWTWGMLYAGKHETDGELPLSAVLASAWGAGNLKGNTKLADELVALGLWRLTDRGFAVCRWSEQGNETKASLDAKRKAGKERFARHELRRKAAANAVPNAVMNSEANGVANGVSNAFPSTSLSSLSSDLSLRSERAQTMPNGVIEQVIEPIDPDEMPDWWDGSCDAAAMALGGQVSDRRALWVRYLASRRRKTWAMNHTDAVGWLADVVRSDRAKAASNPGAKHVQSAKNRCWKLPEGMT